jgi:hypothetical protein
MTTVICHNFIGFMLLTLLSIMAITFCIIMVCFCVDVIRSTFDG